MSATVKISHKTHPHSPTKGIYAKKAICKTAYKTTRNLSPVNLFLTHSGHEKNRKANG